MDDLPQRFIITGAPGSGKSTLLDALRAEGWPCFDEVSREIIAEQTAHGGRLFPWADLAGFAAECVRRMERQLAAAPAGPAFFDRGLPDVVAYLRHGGLVPSDELRRAGGAYERLAFLAPPWREIYRNDPARPQTFAEAEAIDRQIRRAYVEAGITLCELPRGSVGERVHFIRALAGQRVGTTRAHPPCLI